MTRALVLPALLLAACTPDNSHLDVHAFANGCYAVADRDGFLVRDGDTYAFTAAEASAATPLFLRPSDLGAYLLHDPDGGYVVREGSAIVRKESLESDISRVEDGYISGGEWLLEPSERKKDHFQLRSRQDPTLLLADQGLTDRTGRAARLRLEPAQGCTAPPELSLDAQGQVSRTTFDDGELYGIVDAHSHMFTNLGFAGSLFHGSPFHPLGVEHALPDCDIHHGEMGRKDFFGYAFDSGNDGAALGSVLTDLISGELSEDNHGTDGYPTFSDWPDARNRSTHQVQYYRWLERAYLAGLRLVVQHATTNEVICEVSVGAELVPGRYDCSDMVGVDRQIDAVWAMERYIDAQHGGPGKGWFRVVTSPEQARQVIADGKMAVVLGIETSNLFDCYLTPRDDSPTCDLPYVREQLDAYHDRGVRVLFPVHKYDNAFSAGDGDGGFIELGNVINTGHYISKTQDCPGLRTVFDDGRVEFGGFFEPREVYDSEPPLDFSGLQDDPIKTLLPYVSEISDDPIEGDWCQTHGLTPLGEQLVGELMQRGMIVELDHLPQRSYQRAFELLEQADYPAVGTHGNDNDGRLYDIGGISFREVGRCHDPRQKGASWRGFRSRLDDVIAADLHPSLGFAFDLNGFARAPGPRFGPDASCTTEQQDPVTYPFTSHAGDVTFTEPHAGERVFDYNTEGLAHIGLFPEYVHDAIQDAPSDAEVQALFRSAEGYIQLWERTEARAAALRGE